jgi:hypothetical protein
VLNKIVAKIGCGSFDQHDIIKQLQILYFVMRFNFKHFGAWNLLLKDYYQDLSNGLLHAPKFLKSQSLNENNNFAIV